MKPYPQPQPPKQQLSFPLLRDEEILYILQEIQFPMTQKDLNEANGDMIRQIYATFCAESCDLLQIQEYMLANYTLIAECFRTSYQATHLISLPLITLYNYLRFVFAACKVQDFYLSDIVSPTKKRFVLLFSAITNFLRFKSMASDIVNYRIILLASTREYAQMSILNLQSERNKYSDLYKKQADTRQQIQEDGLKYKTQKNDVIQQEYEYVKLTQIVADAKNELKKKDHDRNQLYKQIDQTREKIRQVQQKIISPDAPERLRNQNAQCEEDIYACTKRIDEFQQYLNDLKNKSLRQQEIDYKLESIVSCYQHNYQDRLYLQETQQYLELTQGSVYQFEDEYQEIKQFQKYCESEYQKLQQEDDYFMKELKSENTQNDILRCNREIAELQEANLYLEDDIYNLRARNENLMQQRNQIKKDVLKKQESMVDYLNLLIKGYCVYMQEMMAMFE